MDLKESIEFLEKFNKAVSTLKSQVSYLTSDNKRLLKTEVKYKELIAKEKQARKRNRNNEMLAKHSAVKICSTCDGDGGFDMGECSEECRECSGSGIIQNI